MKRTYIGLIHKEPHTDFWLDFPDIPGCVIGAGDLESLEGKAVAVLQDHVDAVIGAGGTVGLPSTFEEIVGREVDAYVGSLNVEVDISN